MPGRGEAALLAGARPGSELAALLELGASFRGLLRGVRRIVKCGLILDPETGIYQTPGKCCLCGSGRLTA